MIARYVLPLLLTLLAPAAPNAEVSEVQIASQGERTEIDIRVEGQVEVRDFLLEEPTRLIVDLEGANHALPRHVFDGIGRGGVVRLRTSQFRDGVVRLVFELSQPLEYRVRSERGLVQVLLANPGRSFEAWTTAAGPRGTSAPAARASDDGTDDAGVRAVSSAQQTEQPRISVSYEQANMLDVLAGFAEFSGTSIVPGEGVGERTVRGVEIQNQPWDVALDAILTSRGLGWRQTESGIILVDELSNLRGRDTLQTETRLLRVNYANASEIASALENISSAQGSVVPYQGTNSVIVTDAPSVVTRMDSLVQAMDRRTPQVSIEAKIIKVDRTGTRSLGIGYSLIGPSTGDLQQGIGALSSGQQSGGGGSGGGSGGTSGGGSTQQVSLSGSAIAAAGNANGRVPGAALSILAGTTLGNYSLFSFIDALESQSLTDIQATPSIQVMDNEAAEIRVGSRVPVRVLESGAQQQQARATVEFEEVGTILQVTPHVTNDNRVVMDVRAERSGVQLEAGTDVGFIVSEEVGETRLLLSDGETGVIAGLTRSEVRRAEQGIPLLQDLPLLGNLFKTQQRDEVKEDLIILITPHIVNAPGATSTLSSPM